MATYRQSHTSHILVGSFDYADFSTWNRIYTPDPGDNNPPPSAYNALYKTITNGKPNGKRIVDAYVVTTQASVNNDYILSYDTQVGSITYSNIAGGSFNPGESITCDNGSAATIISVGPTELIISIIPTQNAWDSTTATSIDNGLGVTADMDYTFSKTRFVAGSTVTADNGATASVVLDDTAASLAFNTMSGDWTTATSFDNGVGVSAHIQYVEAANNAIVRGSFKRFGGQIPNVNGQSQLNSVLGKIQQLVCLKNILPILFLAMCLWSLFVEPVTGVLIAMPAPTFIRDYSYWIHDTAMDVDIEVDMSWTANDSTVWTAGKVEFYLIVADF